MTSTPSINAIVYALLSSAITIAAPAHAQSDAVLAIDLPAQPLAQSLRDLAASSGTTIIADANTVAARPAPALKGSYSLRAALELLLAGTELEAVATGGGFAIRSQRNNAGEERLAERDIVVTGTRIRGAAPAGAAVITIDRRAIEQSGRATVQDLVSVLPQNFGGGPNEGTLGFTQRNNANANIGAGASINLRGLGTTSTLTLVDGNRLALGAASSIVDISLIPASAIERIEVLADGASAIYGSDAVAGVVNVRLRRGYDGAETAFRVGMADDFSEIQASQLAGLRWGNGSLMAAYEFYKRGRLEAEDRDYATEDLTRFGGPDYRQAFANPGTITAANGAVFGPPQGQDGRSLEAGDLVAGVRRRSNHEQVIGDLVPDKARQLLAIGSPGARFMGLPTPDKGPIAVLIHTTRIGTKRRTRSRGSVRTRSAHCAQQLASNGCSLTPKTRWTGCPIRRARRTKARASGRHFGATGVRRRTLSKLRAHSHAQRYADFGLSLYAGLVAVWIVERDDGSYWDSDWQCSRSGRARHWLAQIAPRFDALFGLYDCLGHMSNGEGVYRRRA